MEKRTFGEKLFLLFLSFWTAIAIIPGLIMLYRWLVGA
jgi:hypothetical protein